MRCPACELAATDTSATSPDGRCVRCGYRAVEPPPLREAPRCVTPGCDREVTPGASRCALHLARLGAATEATTAVVAVKDPFEFVAEFPRRAPPRTPRSAAFPLVLSACALWAVAMDAPFPELFAGVALAALFRFFTRAAGGLDEQALAQGPHLFVADIPLVAGERTTLFVFHPDATTPRKLRLALVDTPWARPLGAPAERTIATVTAEAARGERRREPGFELDVVVPPVPRELAPAPQPDLRLRVVLDLGREKLSYELPVRPRPAALPSAGSPPDPGRWRGS